MSSCTWEPALHLSKELIKKDELLPQQHNFQFMPKCKESLKKLKLIYFL